MRVLNYRFIFIGGIVSVLFVCLFPFKIIIVILCLICVIFGVWNFRNKLGIQRRLLQSGLRLGLTHKSNRDTRLVSNLNRRKKSCDKINNNSNDAEVSNDTLVRRKKDKPKHSEKESPKTNAEFQQSNSTFASPRAFTFGSPRIGTANNYGTSFGGSLLPPATPLLAQRAYPFSVESNSSFQDQSNRCYQFSSTRRILSINRRNPTRQPSYGQLGSFPSIHLSPNPTPLLTSGMGQHTPVTVRIAPPQNFSPSPIKLSFSQSPKPVRVEQDPCDPRTVVAALKENRRKRSLREDTTDWDTGKRQRCDSSTTSSGSLSASVMGESNLMEEGEQGNWDAPPMATMSSKRPATPGPAQVLALKRHKNNAIFSSYSSSKRSAKQMSEVSPPSKKLVRIASPSAKDRFSQTESPSVSVTASEPQASSSSNIGNISQDPHTALAQPVTETPVEAKIVPFPVLREGFSPCQNISFYADIGKASKFVYNMPEYLPTLADYQHDKQIEHQRLNHLLFGKRKGFYTVASKDVTDKSSLEDVKGSSSSFFSDFPKEQSQSSTVVASSTGLLTADSTIPSSLPMFSSIGSAVVTPNVIVTKATDFTSNSNIQSPITTASESLAAPSITSADFFVKSSTLDSAATTTTAGFLSNIPLSDQTDKERNSDIATPTESIFSAYTNQTVADSSFFKPPTPRSNPSTPIQSTVVPKAILDYPGSVLGQPLITTNERNSITTLTTATTTQTSIPTLSLFTSSATTPQSASSLLQSGFASALTTASINSPSNLFSPLTTSMGIASPASLSTSTSSTSKADNAASTGFQFQNKPIVLDLAANQNTTQMGSVPSSNASIFSQPNSMFGTSKPIITSSIQPSSGFGMPAPINNVLAGTKTNNSFGSSPSQSNIFTTSTQPSNSFTVATTPSISFGTSTQPSTTFNASIQPNNAFGVATQPSSAFRGSTTSINSFGDSTQPTNTFGVLSTQTTNTFGSSTQPTNNTFGVSSQPTNTFGISTLPTNTFGVSTQPSNTFGISTQPTNAFGASTQPTSIFGVSTQVSNAFDTSTQSINAFGASVQPTNSFGMSKPMSSSFGTPTQTTNSFGGGSQPTMTFGTPIQTSSSFGVVSQPGNSFGTPTQTSNSFGMPSLQSNTFGQSGQNKTMFGITSPTSGSPFGLPSQQNSTNLSFGTHNTTFGIASQPSTPFSGLSTQANTFGSPTPTGMFGTPQNKSTTDSKPSFGMTSNPPAFGIQQPMSQPQFGSSFGNPAANPAMSFSTSTGQSNAFDSAKNLGLTSAPSVFNNPLAVSSDGGFNTAPASGLNFNFNSKANFNFGATTEAPAFGSSQTFVFTGAPNPGPVNNTLGAPSSFFSIGAGARERKLTVARKRVPRK